jgi:hypothetical protein
MSGNATYQELGRMSLAAFMGGDEYVVASGSTVMIWMAGLGEPGECFLTAVVKSKHCARPKVHSVGR